MTTAAQKAPFVLAIALLAIVVPAAGAAQPPVGLGTAASYGVLAGSAVTNTGPSVINGDLGLSPGTSITGFPPGTVNGATHNSDAPAAQAQADLTVAYDDAAGRNPAATVTGDLGNQTLVAGVYRSASALGLTGTLTLDGQNDANAVFILQAGSALTTASGSRVALINGAQACNVYWQIGSSATLGTSSVFAGTVVALQSVTLNDGVTVDGRVLARNGAVTLINDVITRPACAAGTVPDAGGSGGTGGTTGGGTDGTPGVDEGDTPGAATPPQITRGRCVRRAFRASVAGSGISSVVFSVGSRVVSRQVMAPFAVLVVRSDRSGIVHARVRFSDGRAARTLRLRFKACASAVVSPARNPQAPPAFTG
ncbi:MAG: ice-binding family protein [Solirubrobacteraceae bacterium]